MDGVFDFHPFYKACDTLEISVAAAEKTDIVDAVLIIQIKLDLFGTNACWSVFRDNSSISDSLPRQNYSKQEKKMLGINEKICYTVGKRVTIYSRFKIPYCEAVTPPT